MFSNDIIGSSLGQNGERNTRDVRLFAEGPPSNETADEATLRRTMGSENDSPARQLARFVKEQAGRAVPQTRSAADERLGDLSPRPLPTVEATTCRSSTTATP
jgi:hypothetical protein